MSKIEIGGVKISYSSLQGLGQALAAELVNTEGKLGKAVKEVKRLRRARRALRNMLGGQKAKPAQAASATGDSTREPAGDLR